MLKNDLHPLPGIIRDDPLIDNGRVYHSNFVCYPNCSMSFGRLRQTLDLRTPTKKI